MNPSPVVYSPHPVHLLAWEVLGLDGSIAEIAQPASSILRVLHGMGQGAIRGAIDGIANPYGLRAVTMRLGSRFTQTDGREGVVQQVAILSTPEHRNNDHVTSEMRAGLSAAWQTMEWHFTEVGRTCGISREQTLYATGYLVVPRPDDRALPNMEQYVMPVGLQAPAR